MVGLKLYWIKDDLRKIDTLISTLTSNHCEEDIFFYIKFVISLISRLFEFYSFFLLLMMSKGGESVCLCFVLKLFQIIRLQNKGGDIQDRGSFIWSNIVKMIWFVIIKKGKIVKKISFLDLTGFWWYQPHITKENNYGGTRWRWRLLDY